jgi:acetoin utilization deacetylase AcuC-like enzyme
MKIFYSDNHRKHQPPFEVFDGGKRVPYLENTDRIDRILNALQKTDWAELTPPLDFGLDPIYAMHDKDYIVFLASAWREWLALDPEAAASPEQNVFLPATFALRRKPRVPSTLLGKAGYYMMDLSACIVAGTYEAILSSANCALSAADSAFRNQHSAFALCRPPGITQAKTTRADIASSTTHLSRRIGFRQRARLPSSILTITQATARRIFSMNATTY